MVLVLGYLKKSSPKIWAGLGVLVQAIVVVGCGTSDQSSSSSSVHSVYDAEGYFLQAKLESENLVSFEVCTDQLLAGEVVCGPAFLDGDGAAVAFSFVGLKEDAEVLRPAMELLDQEVVRKVAFISGMGAVVLSFVQKKLRWLFVAAGLLTAHMISSNRLVSRGILKQEFVARGHDLFRSVELSSHFPVVMGVGGSAFQQVSSVPGLLQELGYYLREQSDVSFMQYCYPVGGGEWQCYSLDG